MAEDNKTVTLLQLQDYFSLPLNPEKPAVIYQDEAKIYSMDYNSVEQLANEIRVQIKEIVGEESGFIGVGCIQHVYYPSVLLGILQSGHAFFCLDKSVEFFKQQKSLQILRITHLLVDQDWICRNFVSGSTIKLKILRRVPVRHTIQESKNAQEIFLSKLTSNEFTNVDKTLSSTNWAYAIRTSGTSGNRKIVLVPHQCISPNINSIQQEINMQSKDVVFGSAPPTFDPNIVELFTTLSKCATILYVNDSVKLNPTKLCAVLLSNRVSIMQITPSLYYRFCLEERIKLFCDAASAIRVLMFGGEKIPNESELKLLVTPLASRSVFNIYGTTEVSCWASISKVDEGNLENVPIGKPLSETVVKLFETSAGNEIGIGSTTRLTTVICENTGQIIPPTTHDGISFRMTGDSGVQYETDIIYSGRLDRLVKRNGSFHDLSFIESQLMKTKHFSFIYAFHHMGNIYILYKWTFQSKKEFSSHHTDTSISKLFTDYLPIQSYPDRFIEIEDNEIPVSPNGKLDENFLKLAVLKEELEPSILKKSSLKLEHNVQDFDDMINKFWCRCTAGIQELVNDSQLYFESGGNSMKAVIFVESVMQALSCRGTQFSLQAEKEIMNVLCRESLKNVKSYIFEIICHQHPHSVQQFSLHGISKKESILNDIDNWVEPKLRTTCAKHPLVASKEEIAVEEIGGASIKRWRIPLFGCVDTSAVVVKTFTSGMPDTKISLAIIGGHSGVLVAVDLNILRSAQTISSAIMWTKNFPDRIAASAAVSPSQESVFVACCDCVIYCLDSATGRIKWLYKAKEMFRVSPLPIMTTADILQVLVVSEDSVLTCLNGQDGTVFWTKKSFSTSFKPIEFHNKIIFTSRKSTLIKLDPETTDVDKLTHGAATICTDLVSGFLDKNTFLIYGTILGEIVALNNKFDKIWLSPCGSPAPMSTPTIHCKCEKHEALILCTTFDGCFVCLNMNGEILFHTELNAKCNTSPIVYSNCNIGNESCVALVVDMSSTIHIIELNQGKIIGRIDALVPAKCFSSPVIEGDYLLFGSRDNYFHVIDLATYDKKL